MKKLIQPKLRSDATSRDYERFVISPLNIGYGTILGNVLRRMLLSFIPGAAITSIHVSGVSNRSSAIPNVAENMTQLIAHIKQIRLKLLRGESARLHLTVHGLGKVTAADIVCPPEVEIINPELYLFTVNSDQANIAIELSVEGGCGFSPAQERGLLPIGELALAAIYSPIRRVNFKVEPIGHETNHEKLTLEIWTQGTLGASEALREAAKLLVAHLGIVAGMSTETLPLPEGEPTQKPIVEEPNITDISTLDLPVRISNSLKRAGIDTVGEMLDALSLGTENLLNLRSFGEKSLDEVIERLVEHGYLSPEQEMQLKGEYGEQRRLSPE